jgi:hypothetical protein
VVHLCDEFHFDGLEGVGFGDDDVLCGINIMNRMRGNYKYIIKVKE